MSDDLIRALKLIKKQQIIASRYASKFKNDERNKESAEIYFQQFITCTLILELLIKEFDVSREELAIINHLAMQEIETENKYDEGHLREWIKLIENLAVEMDDYELETNKWQYVKSVDLKEYPDTDELPNDMDILRYGYMVTKEHIRLFFAEGPRTRNYTKEADNDAE